MLVLEMPGVSLTLMQADQRVDVGLVLQVIIHRSPECTVHIGVVVWYKIKWRSLTC